jgi:GNAT superfamily N-acetyltransferase
MSYFCIQPPQKEQEWQAYFDLRFRVLRLPWKQPRGSERDELEEVAMHAALWLNKELIAVGRAHWQEKEIAQVRYMAVEPAHQGKGYGAYILHYLEAKVKIDGGKTVRLNARENALRFYENNGYKIIGAGANLYGVIPHFKMEKHL